MVHAHRGAVGPVLGLILAGCQPAPEGTATDATTTPVVAAPGLADEILDAPGAGDHPYGDPELAVNGVRGSGLNQGSTDVFSLASTGDEAGLTLTWSAGLLVDGPGVDLVIYENPFEHAAGTFMDPVVVELSTDGATWLAWPHDYLAPDETVWSSDAAHWQGFAGITPVLLHEEDHPTDPLDPAVSGGDGFDLAELAGVEGGQALLDQGICCIRLWSASEWVNPDSGQPFPQEPSANGADIDGVYGRVE